VKLEEPLFIIAVHDDGRRIMVGPATTDAGLQRLKTSILSMGWHAGEPMPRMTQQTWFEMAYFERAEAARANPVQVYGSQREA
jgi:hypothetical protein